MGGGSWNGNGDTPAHPSAWCKANQGWVSVVNRTSNGVVTVGDVKNSHRVYRLWKNGAAGKEYFLVEHRKRAKFDKLLPGEGLLVYHVDEAIDGNEDERHPFIKVLEADGRDHLQNAMNRGDGGDPYPGSSGNVSLTHTSNPSTTSYGDLDSSVTVTNITMSARGIKARMTVVGPAGPAAARGASRRSRGSKNKNTNKKKRARKTSRAMGGRGRRR
jgi:immune inhibitor A